jgi:FkbM family methyltransferase
MNPSSLVKAIREVAKEDKVKYDREGGVCNDADKPLNSDRKTVRDVEVHCFEPSPATFNMLTRVHAKLIHDDEKGNKAKWHIHNLGMHQISGEMKWHSACKDSVGNELCGIVEEGTADSITVPVVTVDEFLMDTYNSNSKNDDTSLMPLVHMLKVDAEGLDPAVLTGATKLLTQNRAMMVMFEFNPGLGEGGT